MRCTERNEKIVSIRKLFFLKEGKKEGEGGKCFVILGQNYSKYEPELLYKKKNVGFLLLSKVVLYCKVVLYYRLTVYVPRVEKKRLRVNIIYAR